MKTLFKAIVMVTMLVTSTLGQPPTIPHTPMAVMDVSPIRVQVGTHPLVSWSILYPKFIGNSVKIIPPATLSLSSPMYVSVQIVGSKVTKYMANTTNISTEARISVNGGGYVQLFYGDQTSIDPSAALYIKKLQANNTINFSGRYSDNLTWSPFYTTRNTNFQILALANGDTFPKKGTQPINPNLSPYVNGANKVTVGPMSVLIVMELGETNHLVSNFDYSDQVLLVSFSDKHPNNGHGNNLDGVDSSNPGAGRGGPNGAVDPSAGIDDERK